MPDTTPAAAAVRSASSNTMFGDLPPSSSETRFRLFAAVSYTRAPVVSDPVKVILATPGWLISSLPISGPKPVTTLKIPSGMPASLVSAANSRVEAEVNSDGLTMTAQPAASAAAHFQATNNSGEFQAVGAATTPTGSCVV